MTNNYILGETFPNIKRYLIRYQVLLLSALVLLFAFPGNPAAQSYWMEKGGSPTDDEGYSISIDDSSNTYTTGYFTGTAAFGGFNVTCNGVSDIFVAKTNSNGVYKWVVKGGDGGSDRGLAIKTDAKGNSYVTGYYYGTATFGSKTVSSQGSSDVFVVKYDRNGKVKWVVSCGGTEADVGNAITVDNSGDVLIAGQFTGIATFGAYTLTSTSNNVNVFTAKLDSADGNFLWAKSGTGPYTDRGLGVACDAANNVYVTGQFTDTITFDNAHYSNMYNAIFLVKYNSSGSEQWFTMAGGGTYNIANAITTDKNSNILITGNFTGILTFFAKSNVTLTNKYPNRIFIAKYDASGDLTWDIADGSNNAVTANSISVDGSGNPYIIGNFECIFNGYADHYGQGTFNSVGKWDIFASEYSAGNGAWTWSRQIGGQGNNYGNSIAVDASADVFTAGSFDQDMIITAAPPSFAGYRATAGFFCDSVYCSDNHYGYYAYFNTTGNLDIFIAKPFNLSRQTYDFYIRKGAGCNRPKVGVCIGTNPAGPCLDTAKFCTSGIIYAVPNTCPITGPTQTYLWSNGSNANSIIPQQNGWYYVTQTSTDECDTSRDSIYVLIHPVPQNPTISDNVIINTNSINPAPIRLCERDVKLTGGNYKGDVSWYWTTPNNVKKDSVSIMVGLHSDSGFYCFTVIDTFGCTNQTCVWVAIDSMLTKIIPKLKCTTCIHDSAYLCKGNSFTMFPYDSITNPDGNLSKCIPPSAGTWNYWYAKPNTITFDYITNCPDENTFIPSDSGWYVITDTIKRHNYCDTIPSVVKDSVYVHLYPNPPPINLMIYGKSLLCNGDSEWISAGGYSPFVWSNGSTADSIYVGAGDYAVYATDSTIHGCTSYGSASIGVEAPTITTPTVYWSPSNGVICPGDSVRLSFSGGPYQICQWYGPNGLINNDSSVIYVNTAGSYYCFVTDTIPCQLSRLSNTVVIEQYSTPYLATSDYNICPGDSLAINVMTSAGAVVTWLPPLKGNSSTQYVDTAGTYSVQVVSCSITTLLTVTVTMSHPFAGISAVPSTILCNVGDSVLLKADSGMAVYKWNPGRMTGQNVTVTSGGTYTLVAADAFGCTASASIEITPPLNGSINAILTPNCASDSNKGSIGVAVKGGSGVYTYNWTPNVTSNASANNLTQGSYTVLVKDSNGCHISFTDTISSVITPQAKAAFTGTPDTIQPGESVILTNYSTGASSYFWNFGDGTTAENASSHTYYADGTYKIMLIAFNKNGCPDTTYITIVVIDEAYFPNVFTPNGDGVNDIYYFRITGVLCFHCYIYNRWGLCVYELYDVAQGWPGIIRQTGLPASAGVYYYLLDYCDYSNKQYQKAGFIQLIR